MKGMRNLVLVAALLLVPGCANGNQKAQQEKIEALETENAALKGQQAATAVAAAGAQQAAVAQAASDYAKRCAMAIEMLRIDDPDMRTPETLNQRSCADSALGDSAETVPFGVASSVITVDSGGGYSIAVTDTNGGQVKRSSE